MLNDFNILHQNLNDEVSYQDFFHALGYKDNDVIFLRTFYDPDKDQGTPRNSQVTVSNFDSIIPTLKERNAEKYGVYFVVNGGGTDITSVKRHGYARACFIDGDELSIEDQLKFLVTFKLEPSIIIRTRKSLHAYWLTPDGDLKYFRELQERLIQYFGSDPVIKDESRVMRLYGFNHCKADPVPVTLIKFDPDITYTQRQLHEALPRLEKKPKNDSVNITAARDPIPYGQRHNYVIQRISFYMRTIGDNTTDEIILSAVCTDFLQNCSQEPPVDMESFRAKYLKTIQKYRATKREAVADPGTYSKAATLWHKKHPGQEIDDSNDTWDEILADYIEYKATHENENAIETTKTDYTPGDPSEALANIERENKEAAEAYKKENNVANQLKDFINGIADSVNTPPISTGFEDLDKALEGGLYEGLYCLGAVSSLGKTTLTMQIADQIAQQGEDVLIISLEMARTQLMAKSISRHTLIEAQKENDIGLAKTSRGITTGARYEHYSDKEKQLIRKAIDKYSEYADHLYIKGEIGKIGTDEIREAVEKHKKIMGRAPILIIDYLQILKAYDVRATDKRNIDENVVALKQLSRDYKIPVFVISSFNREGYKGGAKEATMTDFKESGAIEYGADVLIGLHFKGAGQPGFDLDEAYNTEPREVELKILKNREGKPGQRIEYAYYPKFNYFTEWISGATFPED